MKSVIQEASSLTKAIELGWVKAGKPREFTVKIYQEAKKNFFGMTIIAAKVAIFFKETESAAPVGREQATRQHQQQRPRHHQPRQGQQNQGGQQKRRYYPQHKKRPHSGQNQPEHQDRKHHHSKDDSNNQNYSHSSNEGNDKE